MANPQTQIDLDELDKMFRSKKIIKPVTFTDFTFLKYLKDDYEEIFKENTVEEEEEGDDGEEGEDGEEREEGVEKEESIENENEYREKEEPYEFYDYGLPEEEFIEVITEYCKKNKTPSNEEIQKILKKRAEEIFLG